MVAGSRTASRLIAVVMADGRMYVIVHINENREADSFIASTVQLCR